MVRILGVDPGLGNIGFGIVDMSGRGCFQCASWHEERRNKKTIMVPGYYVSTPATLALASRLEMIGAAVGKLIERDSPDCVVVEQFMGTVKSSLKTVEVGAAYGVILYEAMRREVPVFTYTPSQVKATVTNRGDTSVRDAIKDAVDDILAEEGVVGKHLVEAAGFGQGDKDPVEFAVRSILGFKEEVRVNHVSDAFAVALTHGTLASWSAVPEIREQEVKA